MILDEGICIIYAAPTGGGIAKQADNDLTEVYRSWYGSRTVGMQRYYAASQVNARIDMLIRILSPQDRTKITAGCTAVASGKRYRVLQAQYLRDEESGEDVCDITLERIGDKYERT